MKLDYKRMILEVYKIIDDNHEFLSEMESRSYQDIEFGTFLQFRQKDAIKMAQLLAEIYSISHCVKCKSCQNRYKLIGLEKE